MKKLISRFILVVSFLFVSNLSAQQWTDARKEVWKAVETYNDLADKGDLEGFYADYSVDKEGKGNAEKGRWTDILSILF